MDSFARLKTEKQNSMYLEFKSNQGKTHRKYMGLTLGN